MEKNLVEILSQIPLETPHGIESWKKDHVLFLGERISVTEGKSFNLPANAYPELIERAAGTIGFAFFHYWNYHNVFEVISLGVEPEYEGQGYCSKMIAWSEEAARRLGCNSIQFRQVKNQKVAEMLRRRDYLHYLPSDYWTKPALRKR
ncbi:GNAT family N-acetyltransferase [Candidatus Woesearchaeota archaeon]|nr:GNAT family N-acetyltransferase [Candidatus Woesearchaeota archaeon]